MSKNDIILKECNFDSRRTEIENFRLHQTGSLNDMRNWQHKGLGGAYWRCYHHTRSGSSIRVDRRQIPLLSEELIFIPENNPFDALGAANVTQYWIHFSPPLQFNHASQITRLPITPPITDLLKEWRRLVTAATESYQPLSHICKAILHACFARLVFPTAPTASLKLQMVLEEIERLLATPPDNKALATMAGRSVEGFIRWFRMETGMTPARYVVERRIRQASRLLSLYAMSIEEIAEEVGFLNRHHFTRVFTRYTGQPPARFRAQQREF
jgi:AraC family transcriptional regulator, arabinose operon regulatory protein